MLGHGIVGGLVLFGEQGLWERYRWQVTTALGAGLLQAVLGVDSVAELARLMERWKSPS